MALLLSNRFTLTTRQSALTEALLNSSNRPTLCTLKTAVWVAWSTAHRLLCRAVLREEEHLDLEQDRTGISHPQHQLSTLPTLQELTPMAVSLSHRHPNQVMSSRLHPQCPSLVRSMTP